MDDCEDDYEDGVVVVDDGDDYVNDNDDDNGDNDDNGDVTSIILSPFLTPAASAGDSGSTFPTS